MIKIDKNTAIIQELEQIVDDFQYADFYWTTKKEALSVDVQTANMLLQVYKAINEENKKMIVAKMKTSRAIFGVTVDFAWSCVSPKK